MSRFVNIKQSLLIAFNFMLLLFAINSVYACLLGSSVGGNCGVTFTFKAIPLFLAGLITSVIYLLYSIKVSRLRAVWTFSIILFMWFLAYFYIYAKLNNYL